MFPLVSKCTGQPVYISPCVSLLGQIILWLLVLTLVLLTSFSFWAQIYVHNCVAKKSVSIYFLKFPSGFLF